MKTFESVGIKFRAGARGLIKTECHACQDDRVKHKHDKPLSVHVEEGWWNCHHCGYSGNLKEPEKKSYIRPQKITESPTEKMVLWFGARFITKQTLEKFQVAHKDEWMPQAQALSSCIVFPYIKDGKPVNNKFRDGAKNFKMEKGGELVVFNYDGIRGKKVAVITEGEIDALSVFEAGVCDDNTIGVCSVPNGASKGSQKLEYLDNSWEAFAGVEKIIIATDADDPGVALKAELSRRFGKHRCSDIVYPPGCKDLNEVLVKHGKDAVKACIAQSKPIPVEGIYRLSDFESDVDFLYENGYQSGATIGYREFDEHMNFNPGQLTVVTGIPGSGKSTFLDQVLVRLTSRNGWKHGICSFEKQPITKHISYFSRCYIGKPFLPHSTVPRMDRQEKDAAKVWINDSFFWFKVRDEDVSIEGIISRARHLVTAHGINSLVIDPYNYLESRRKATQTETEYISEVLGALCDFARDYDIHVFLVAHPTKMAKAKNKEFEVPNLYNIAGSHNFYAKPDNGWTVHRNRSDNTTVVYIQKIRYEPENGKLGNVGFMFDPATGRYREEGEPNFVSEYLWGKDKLTQTEIAYAANNEPASHKIFEGRHVTDNEPLPF
jgi:twinkle protein